MCMQGVAGMKHVYIAHHTKDGGIKRYIEQSLQAAGCATWEQNGLIPGTMSWTKAIETAIKQAGCVVVLMSPDGKLSKWLEREVSYASLYGVSVIPMLVRGEQSNAIPTSLISRNWHDARDLDRALRTVIGEVRRALAVG